jgi:hypothetical protein
MSKTTNPISTHSLAGYPVQHNKAVLWASRHVPSYSVMLIQPTDSLCRKIVKVVFAAPMWFICALWELIKSFNCRFQRKAHLITSPSSSGPKQSNPSAAPSKPIYPDSLPDDFLKEARVKELHNQLANPNARRDSLIDEMRNIGFDYIFNKEFLRNHPFIPLNICYRFKGLLLEDLCQILPQHCKTALLTTQNKLAGFILLHGACANGNLELAALIIKYMDPQDCCIQSNQGNNPLHCLVMSTTPISPQALAPFLKLFPDRIFFEKNGEGLTPYELAVRRKEEFRIDPAEADAIALVIGNEMNRRRKLAFLLGCTTST